jgi:hypothetical protein
MVVVAALGAMLLPAAAQERLRGGGVVEDRLRVSYGRGNSLFVQVIPDGRPPMPFESEGSDAWAFRGDTASLVGKSYTIRLENRGRSRIKVVVGVDGVNAYFRKPIAGTADRDIGSILGPGQNRVLTGFQADEETAQRFVFSPQEFSEGGPVRGARVGEIEVHVYEEYRPDVDVGRSQNRESPAPSAAPSIGTTAGEDVDSDVRRVSFRASTREPIARLELAYGRPDPVRQPPPEPDQALGPLGVAVEQQRDGLRIVHVERDGLGDEIGLREGDVITKVDTYARPTAAVLRRILRAKGRGDYLFLEVLRGRHVANFKTRL